MKKFLAFLLSLTMVFAMAAVAFAEGETYLWDNFDDRDPNAKPELAPNGVHLWWDNWANLRAKNEDGALKLDMRPKAYDPEDYDSKDDYYAHAADWMANWGEAIDMWGLDGVSYCKYLTIRIKGADGKMYLAHTLNNTCVAPPRMLIAFLENHLQKDGTVTIPKCLQPYMGGKELLVPKH